MSENKQWGVVAVISLVCGLASAYYESYIGAALFGVGAGLGLGIAITGKNW